MTHSVPATNSEPVIVAANNPSVGEDVLSIMAEGNNEVSSKELQEAINTLDEMYPASQAQGL